MTNKSVGVHCDGYWEDNCYQSVCKPFMVITINFCSKISKDNADNDKILKDALSYFVIVLQKNKLYALKKCLSFTIN